MPSRETVEALGSEEFLWGLTLGFIALALGAIAIYAWRQWRDQPAGIIAALVTGAAGAGLAITSDPPSELAAGMGLLAIAGALHPLARRIPFLPAALAVPGAWWVTRIVDLPGEAWVTWALMIWIVGGSVLVASFERFHLNEAGPLLLLITVAGMFVTLPDTEEILVVLGAATALAVLAWPRLGASLGSLGTYPLLGLLAWVIAEGGEGRESAVIGAIGALGLFAIEPVVRGLRGATALDRLPTTWWRVPAVAAAHAVIVLLITRVAGTSGSAMTAIALAVAFAIAALLAMSASVRRS